MVSFSYSWFKDMSKILYTFYDPLNRRLVVSQNMAMDGVQTTLGLLATDIPSRVEVVLAKMSFSCTNSWGVELSPGE